MCDRCALRPRTLYAPRDRYAYRRLNATRRQGRRACRSIQSTRLESLDADESAAASARVRACAVVVSRRPGQGGAFTWGKVGGGAVPQPAPTSTSVCPSVQSVTRNMQHATRKMHRTARLARHHSTGTPPGGASKRNGREPKGLIKSHRRRKGSAHDIARARATLTRDRCGRCRSLRPAGRNEARASTRQRNRKQRATMSVRLAGLRKRECVWRKRECVCVSGNAFGLSGNAFA